MGTAVGRACNRAARLMKHTETSGQLLRRGSLPQSVGCHHAGWEGGVEARDSHVEINENGKADHHSGKGEKR